MPTEIHATAVIDDAAELGEGVVVGPFAVISADTRMGDGCRVGPHAVVHPFTTLGAGCVVHAGAVLGDIPQDLGFTGVPSTVRIGDRCVFREGVTVHRGTAEDSETVLGDDCYLMNNSHVAHNCRLGNNVIMANNAVMGGYAEVGDGTFVAGQVAIHQFVRIGRLAMLGGVCGVSKDVPPFCMTEPVSANRVLGLNVVGLRRAGFTAEQRREIKSAFKILYQSGLNTTDAVVRLREAFTSGPAAEFAEFVDASERGICAGTRKDAIRTAG